MTKKAVTKMEPTISTIPMPVSDNPVVIDLPDGQKLVLGKLTAGSVIEVATWRGTGRPDSRTNRMMLGMTDGTSPVVSTPSSESAPATGSRKKISLPFGSISLPRIGGSQLKSLKQLITGATSSFSKALERTRELAPVETTAELDINAWIENISREAEQKNARAQARATSSAKKATPAKKPGNKAR
jgi:hypothetical protein